MFAEALSSAMEENSDRLNEITVNFTVHATGGDDDLFGINQNLIKWVHKGPEQVAILFCEDPIEILATSYLQSAGMEHNLTHQALHLRAIIDKIDYMLLSVTGLSNVLIVWIDEIFHQRGAPNSSWIHEIYRFTLR